MTRNRYFIALDCVGRTLTSLCSLTTAVGISIGKARSRFSLGFLAESGILKTYLKTMRWRVDKEIFFWLVVNLIT